MSLQDVDTAATLNTLSRIRGLLDKYEAALTAHVRIPSRGLNGEPLYRRAVNIAYATLADGFNAELAAVPVGVPAAIPATKPSVPSGDTFVVDEGALMMRRARSGQTS